MVVRLEGLFWARKKNGMLLRFGPWAWFLEASHCTRLKAPITIVYWLLFLANLLAMSIGQRLCINFYVSRANFLTTLRSHLEDFRFFYLVFFNGC